MTGAERGTPPLPGRPRAWSTCWRASPTTRPRRRRSSTSATRALRPGEAGFLRSYYVEGLGEFALCQRARPRRPGGRGRDRGRGRPAPPSPVTSSGPLLPFGGGIDSIVTVEATRAAGRDMRVVRRRAARRARFAAIEDAAAVTGLPVVRADRTHRPQVLRWRASSASSTGTCRSPAIISAIAVLAAVLEGRDAVVMSNEWSASIGNVVASRRPPGARQPPVLQELGVRERLARGARSAFDAPPQYFSFLRAVLRAVGRPHASPRSSSITRSSAAAIARSTTTPPGGSTTGAASATSAASST